MDRSIVFNDHVGSACVNFHEGGEGDVAGCFSCRFLKEEECPRLHAAAVVSSSVLVHKYKWEKPPATTLLPDAANEYPIVSSFGISCCPISNSWMNWNWPLGSRQNAWTFPPVETKSVGDDWCCWSLLVATTFIPKCPPSCKICGLWKGSCCCRQNGVFFWAVVASTTMTWWCLQFVTNNVLSCGFVCQTFVGPDQSDGSVLPTRIPTLLHCVVVETVSWSSSWSFWSWLLFCRCRW